MEMFDAFYCRKAIGTPESKQAQRDTSELRSLVLELLAVMHRGRLDQTRYSYEEKFHNPGITAAAVTESSRLAHCIDGVMQIAKGRRGEIKRGAIIEQLSKAAVDIITRCNWYCKIVLIACLVCTAVWSRAQSPSLDFR